MHESIRVCRRDEVPEGEARRFDVDGLRLCVVRIGDDFYVIGDECSHEDYSLAEGEVFADDGTIECWKHGSLFSLTTGAPETLPATQPVPVFDVTIEGDDVLVTRGRR